MSGKLTRIEPATPEDLNSLAELIGDLFDQGEEFEANAETQKHGLRLILEAPTKGRIYVIRTDHRILGMVNLLFTISTAEGGPVILMEDLVIHPDHRRLGLGGQLLEYVKDFATKKGFKRITLLTEDISEESLEFFARHGFADSAMTPMRWRSPAAK
jgi:N-acetylglutamate synthase-like GNAT family acetyltransferase